MHTRTGEEVDTQSLQDLAPSTPAVTCGHAPATSMETLNPPSPAHCLIRWHCPTDPLQRAGPSGLRSRPLQSVSFPAVSL